MRHQSHHLVEQIAGSGAIDGRNGEGFSQSQGIKFAFKVNALIVIVFVGDQHHGFFGASQNGSHVVVEVGDTIFDVDHKQNHISFLNGECHLLIDFIFKNIVAVHHPSTGVHHRHFHAFPFGFAILSVARGTAFIVHDSGSRFG